MEIKGILKLLLLTCSSLCLIVAVTFPKKESIGASKSIALFKADSKVLAKTILQLGTALNNVDSSNQASISAAKTALSDSRLAYKKLEYFLEYFLATSSRIYNRAPKNEIEEPFMGYQAPAGFQYIEAMLYDDNPAVNKQEFKDQIRLMSLSAENLNSLVYQFEGTDAQILASIWLQLIRVMTLGITGFDAPSLKTGIHESKVCLESMRQILLPYFNHSGSKSDSVSFFLDQSVDYLAKNPDFDSFNRLEFLVKCALPLQKHLSKMIKALHLENSENNALNNDADHIFSPNAFDWQFFQGTQTAVSDMQIMLGKQLFFEPMLSGNNQKSCASCHNPANYFTDGLPKSIGFLANTTVKRNAPTLLYSGYQHNQFWDGRVKSLEQQIESVIKDSLEMNGDVATILEKLNSDGAYRKSFRKAFPGKEFRKKYRIDEKQIYSAIAGYVRTLNPYNSAFDQYINGDKKALTDGQISGFNLFMGKAQCGTCHFAPLFNGLIPPQYVLTEFEILGTTKTDDLEKAEIDDDPGRYTFRPTPFFNKAFKTPTVRNSAVTGPYMHNGMFKSLETLIEFYNQGGGAGLGLNLQNQTLSAAKLNLNENEKTDIVSFLNSLTDTIDDQKTGNNQLP